MKLSTVFKNFTLLGIEFAEDEAEKQQIIITNFLVIMSFFISSIGLTISCFEGYSVALYSYLTFFISQFFIIYLQRSGLHLFSRILLTILPPILLLVPSYFFNSYAKESSVEYFYVLLASSVLPLLLFNTKKDTQWLLFGIAYGLFFILTYDTIFGIKSTPARAYLVFDTLYLKFKIRQLMLYFVIMGGYLVKIRLSQYFELRLRENNRYLSLKNNEIHEMMNSMQLQNEELHAQEEEMRSQNEDLHLNQQEIIAINTRIEKFTQVLILLTKSKNLQKGNLKSALEEICKTTAEALEIQRVGIWEYDKKQNSIICINQYESLGNANGFGFELWQQDYQPYFDALNSEEIIVANNAALHYATSCFEDSYLDKYQIKSMLDAPYFANETLAGVICAESIGAYKNWSGEDIVFLKSIADLISLCFESAERKKAEDRIRIQKEEILCKNEELLQNQEEIRSINENLERKVAERTISLERKNSQLQEYTYINSHLLRGPLCRILGIVYLLENNMLNDTNIDFLLHLKQSASELDDMVKKITRNLETGQPIGAEDFMNPHEVNAHLN